LCASGKAKSEFRSTLTTYKLEFLPSAQKEWSKLDSSLQKLFAKKLRERLAQPRVPSARLSGMPDCYKIKLKDAGYRLVYRIFDDRVVVQVVAVGRRERNQVYKTATGRLS
jgi:mRNA interferase RelE/StbE